MLILAISICMCNNYTATDNPYYKAYLVKVIEVIVLDAVLYVYISYYLELRVYLVRVFVEGPLKVIGIRYTCLELRAALYKAVCLLGTKGLCVIRCKEGFCYIFYTTNLGQKPLCIKVKDVLYKRLFFN